MDVVAFHSKLDASHGINLRGFYRAARIQNRKIKQPPLYLHVASAQRSGTAVKISFDRSQRVPGSFERSVATGPTVKFRACSVKITQPVGATKPSA